MKYALINPNWTFYGSIYFGCKEPHFPLEYGYARGLIEREGHEAVIIDAHLERMDTAALQERVRRFGPDVAVVTTAPSYLFWRCPPPELRVPLETIQALREEVDILLAIGPHGSITPGPVLRKLKADAVIIGEPEAVLPRFAGKDRPAWGSIPSICYRTDGALRVQGGPYETDMSTLPPLYWPQDTIRKHVHHHHRFDTAPKSPGAEMETSRGCPYHCSFCARSRFRGRYRKRPLSAVLDELDGLLGHGVEYIYFIDEIFMPDIELLNALSKRTLHFGIQTRIDLWMPEMLDLLGSAGCVSIEAGVESMTAEGRGALNKKCLLSTDDLAERLICARQRIPFVQATLMESGPAGPARPARPDSPEALAGWRDYLLTFGVWTNTPVPLFPYPGSEEYRKRWGAPDDGAWERAHAYYVSHFETFSDIQENRPLSLQELETPEVNRSG